MRRSVLIAAVVGTLLFAVNQLDVVVRGEVTPFVVVKIVLTYCVPFCVAMAGALTAARR